MGDFDRRSRHRSAMHSIRSRTHRPTAILAGAAVTASTAIFAGGCATNTSRPTDRDAPHSVVDERDHLGKCIRISSLAGVWSVEHVDVLAREGLSSLPPEEAAAIHETWTRTDRTNTLLREQRLSIVHTLNADGTYTHNLEWADPPERRFKESGTWTIDRDGVIRCFNSTGEASSLPEARVLYMDDSSLIVRMYFSGPSAGQAEIIRHRRLTRAQDAQVDHPPTPFIPSQN